MRTLQIGLLLTLFLSLVGCGDQIVGWPNPEATDDTAPTVTFVSPGDAATGVVVDTVVTAIFSKSMDPVTISGSSFQIIDGTTRIAGDVTFTGVTATFDPFDDLDGDVTYEVVIDESASDLAGNTLAEDYRWSFTTEDRADETPPEVTATTPVDGAVDVDLNSMMTATFSEEMDPLTFDEMTFIVSVGATSVPGEVTFAGRTATFRPDDAFEADEVITATVTGSVTDLAGNSMGADYTWEFTTGLTPDTLSPTVRATVPLDGDVDVAVGRSISAVFSEAMNPATVNTASFTVDDGALPVGGTVTLVGNDVTFDPDDDLLPSTEYTATITIAATDLAGNALAADYVWTFTTGEVLDTDPPTVILTAPEDLDTDVPLNSTVNATFSEPMDLLTITDATFIVELPDGNAVPGTVSYDVPTRIATFSPTDDLLPNTTYTATVTTGVADLSGNTMVSDFVWNFTTGTAVVPGLQSVNLGSLTSFVAVAGAGLTNSNSSGPTVLNGDVGLSPDASCVADGSPCTITNPVINGTLYANDPAGVAAQAKVDLTAAYVDATSRPPGTTVNDISGMVLTPGVYTSASTMSIAVGGTVTLDGQGDPNAVFIFQIGSSLTVNNNATVLLINGARAKNVFWAVFASSTLGDNVDFSGSVLAGASNSVGTDSVVLGRLLSGTGAITLLSNTITLPAP